jgi:hypothetical protein
MRKASREMPSRKSPSMASLRGVGDGMHQAVEAVPVLAQVGEQPLDLASSATSHGKTSVLSNSLANLLMRSLKRSFW